MHARDLRTSLIRQHGNFDITHQGRARRKSVINREQREKAKKQNNETGYLGRLLR
jgi:hypothetical protein